MNILIISTSDIHGGAALAAFRLMNALNACGVNANMLVRDKFSDNDNVMKIGNKIQNKWNFYLERGQIFLNNRFSKENLFAVSLATTGVSITEHPEFKKADIIHLHWINQGMLSIGEIGKILASGKKVVWTMHDMWAFTGICHYSGQCNHFEKTCGHCPLLATTNENDISERIFKRKKSAYSSGKITFVACSRWLGNLAKKSPLTFQHQVFAIPNTIDTHIYSPQNKTAVRQKLGFPAGKKIVLFAAVKASDKRKGMEYLLQAEKLLEEKKGEMLFLVVGKTNDINLTELSVETRSLGFIASEKMTEIYNAADVFVTPSLQDNLPNTIMEAMACGTPCVGFNIGGIPEMIDHLKTGYVAEYKNSEDLAKGLLWTLFEADAEALSINSREKVLAEYAQETIVKRYLSVYEE